MLDSFSALALTLLFFSPRCPLISFYLTYLMLSCASTSYRPAWDGVLPGHVRSVTVPEHLPEHSASDEHKAQAVKAASTAASLKTLLGSQYASIDTVHTLSVDFLFSYFLTLLCFVLIASLISNISHWKFSLLATVWHDMSPSSAVVLLDADFIFLKPLTRLFLKLKENEVCTVPFSASFF